jgi:hypothetical protein
MDHYLSRLFNAGSLGGLLAAVFNLLLPVLVIIFIVSLIFDYRHSIPLCYV